MVTVAVPPSLADMTTGTGHGAVWRHGLEQLRRHVDVVVLDPEPPGRRWRPGRRARRPDVWLNDGHQQPLPVAEPVVVHVHEAGWDTPELRACFEPSFVEILERQTSASVRAAARVITPSRSSASQLSAQWGVEADRIDLVPFGVDHRVFHPGQTGAAAVIERSGGDGRIPYVLYVSLLHPRKNLEAVRDAVDRLRLAGHPHQLVVVGRPAPDRHDPDAEIRAAVAPLPQSGAPVVRVVDPSDDEVAALMVGATALAQASLMEGFGLTPLEAMACGTPVVVSDRGSLPEVVGDAGLVVPPDGASVAAAVAKIIDDPELAASLAAAGRARALGFSWEVTGAGWAEVLTATVADTEAGRRRA